MSIKITRDGNHRIVSFRGRSQRVADEDSFQRVLSSFKTELAHNPDTNQIEQLAQVDCEEIYEDDYDPVLWGS